MVVNADSTISATGEVNADDTGVSGAGGLISLTAPTLTVTGTLHANGGGAVTLQACSLTLEPAGQVLATGLGGFTLLQASGPMEIDGTLVPQHEHARLPGPGHRLSARSPSRPIPMSSRTFLRCRRCALVR